MANGPFTSYAPPSTYSQTRRATQVTGPPSGLQIPIFIGVGKETLSQVDYELVRGSSSSIDQEIRNEDVSARFILDDTNIDNPVLGTVDGMSSRFKVENLPIVVGDGRGLTTNRPQDVDVTIDGIQVVVAAVDGERGILSLQIPPAEGSTVKVSYSFNRTDTFRTDTLSSQVTDEPAVLKADLPENYVITSGTNELRLRVNGTDHLITLDTGSQTASDIASFINVEQIAGLTAGIDLNNQGEMRLQLQADGSLQILESSALPLFGFSAGQQTDRNRSFHTYYGPIVDGNDGGVTTTDPLDIRVYVNGQQVNAAEVDGANGTVVLSEPPVVGATVLVEYYHNTFQNTFDYLPNRDLVEIDRLGDSPDRNDYVQSLDYILKNDTILWGSAATVQTGEFTPVSGNEAFGEDQITAQLTDNRIYLEEVERLTDTSLTPSQPSSRTVVLSQIPTDGSGRDNPTSDVRNVKVYHGPTVSQAVQNGAVEVVKVVSDTRQVTVKNPIPFGSQVFVTYYYNRLQDDTYTLRRTQAGRVRVSSQRTGQDKLNVRWVGTDSSETVQWPSGVESRPDALVTGSNGVREEVTVTFTEVGAVPASFTNTEAGPYDIFAGTSDSFGVATVDGTSQSLDINLNQSAFGVLISERKNTGSNFVVTAGDNDTFAFRVDGTNYSVEYPAGTHDIATIAEGIWRQLPATLLGTEEETFDITLGADDTFDFTLNGTPVSVTLTDGTGITAATIAGEINTAIDLTALTSGDPRVLGNDGQAIVENGQIRLEASETILIDSGNANTVLGFTPAETDENIKVARTWEGATNEYLLLRSRVIPQGPADESEIRVLTGSANGLLGFEDLAQAEGTESAVNKGATLLSETLSAGMQSNLAAQEPDFEVLIDGSNYIVDGSVFAGLTSVASIATAIDNVLGVGGANVATTVAEGSKIRITSDDTSVNSAIEIGNGAANQYLGFSAGDAAGQRRPSASDIVSVLNNDTAEWTNQTTVNLFTGATATDFLKILYAETETVSGVGEFVKISSFNTGDTVSFTFEDTTNTVFNDTGIGIEVGDNAQGVDGVDGFTVASDRAEGSTGTGIVGQTYTDAFTGLRFTVLPSEGAGYVDTETFTLRVERDMVVGSATINRAVDGVEMRISSLSDVAVNDTALVETFDKSGDEPGIGDFYYISYDYQKSNFEPRLFTRFREVQENYGELGPENALSLAAYLALLNGASIVATQQVIRTPGSTQAPAQSYIDVLDRLKTDIEPGISPDIIVPLTPDPQVMAAVTKHCEIQSSPRNRNERRAIFGVASGTRPQDARELARSLNSELAMLLYPDSAIMSLTDEVGQQQSFIVDGTFIAAALAGKMVSPVNDVATPWTRRQIVGFDRLNRSLDETEKNLLATAGVTVIQDRVPFLEVRHGLTTNLDSILTKTPSVIAIKHFVQQQSRATLDSFIGLKFLASEAQNVELAMTGLLNSLVESNIISTFQGVSAEPDPNDPTMLHVEAYYSPVFPLLYIRISFSISSGTQ